MTATPNVLFVFADQWRGDAVGYAGNPDVHTPHLDALAKRSLVFNHCVSGTPVCCPWRASMLSGTYPDRHGVFLNDGVLPPDTRTFGEHFSEAGYDTAWIGKWHVDGHGRSSFIPRERQHQFAYFKALECTHDYNNSHYYAQDDPTLQTWEGYDAIAQTTDMINWLQTRDDAEPFLAFLSWGPPHNPYQTAPDEYRDMYDPAELTLLPNVPDDTKEKAASDLAGYYAHCSALDACMGRLLKTLDEEGLTENTIVVFTSDHGDMIGSFGMWEKSGPWEQAMRVPMLLHDPRAAQTHGQSTDVVFNMVDHLPTLCGLAGIDPPLAVQGRDLSSYLLSGSTPNDNDALYGSYHRYGTWLSQDDRIDALYRCREARGVRTTQYTYVEDLNGPWLLYDLHHDPHQLHNRVNDPAFADVQERLSLRLQAKLNELGDEFKPGDYYTQKFYPDSQFGSNNERRGKP